MARVFQINKKWYIDLWFEGKRIRKVVGKSKAAAEKRLAAERVKIDRGEYNPPGSRATKFSDFCELYLERKRRDGKRSVDRMEDSIAHLKEFFGNIRLASIRPALIEEYKDLRRSMSTRRKDENGIPLPVSGATINRELAQLRNIFSKAIAWEKFYGRNPVLGVELNPENPQSPHILTDEEFEAIYNALPERIRPIMLMALNTVLRKDEILGLEWSEVDIDRGIIIKPLAKGQRNREVVMNSWVRAYLEAAKKQRHSKYVFINPETGTRYSNIVKSWKSAVTKAGLPKFLFHHCKHNAATFLDSRGIGDAILVKIAGHSKATTTRHYTHPQRTATGKAMEYLAAKFAPPTLTDKKPDQRLDVYRAATPQPSEKAVVN
jgi:integrase